MVLGTPIVLNLIPSGARAVAHVNEVDQGAELQFAIYNGNTAYNVPEGVTATIRGTKGDGFGYTAAAAVTVGSNIITVTLDEQMTAVAGVNNVFELVLANSNGFRAGTSNFILDVERAALNENTVVSDSDLAYAEQVLNDLQSVQAVNTQVQQNKAGLAAEISNRQAAVSAEASARQSADQILQQNINAEATARQAADNTLQSNINAEASTRATTDASLQSQIDQLIAPSGEAPSAAEVENARIGSDGTVYPTLGDAIRTQNSLLKSQIDTITEDVYTDETLTPTISPDTALLPSGNTTTLSAYKLATYAPLVPGTTLEVQVASVADEHPIYGVNYAFYSGGVSSSNLVGNTHTNAFSGVIKVPENATALCIVQTSNSTNFVKSLEPKTDDLQSQINSVDDAIESKLPYIQKTISASETIEKSVSFDTVGLLSMTDGSVISSETAYKTSNFIPLNDIVGVYRTGTTIMFTLWRYAFYDSRKRFLGIVADTTNYSIVSYNGKQVTWLDLSDYPTAAYMRVSWNISRSYTYYAVYHAANYDIPHILIKGIEPLKFYGKTIVNFGDSIFGNYRDTNDTTDKSISRMIAEATGATVYNCGFGGCRMAYHSQYWRAFSMYALADAITTNVWTDQDAAIAAAPSGMPSYFSDTLTLLKSIDFDTVDYITIGYGVNDYSGDVWLDYREGLTENQYFKGALAYSLRTILDTYPQIRIIVITPCWKWFPDADTGLYDYSSDDAASVNTRGYKLTDYVEACETVCESYHVPCINTYDELGFNQYSYKAYFYVKGIDGASVSDGTHPKLEGRQLRADRIIGQLGSLY